MCGRSYHSLLTIALFWQQTGLAVQALPEPTPMTEMGEQSIPRRTSTPWTTMPSRPRRRLPAGELACDSIHSSIQVTGCASQGTAYFLSALAALDSASVAVAGGIRGCGTRGSHRDSLGRRGGLRGSGSSPRGGDRKDGEREQRIEERKRRDTAEHDDKDVVGAVS